MSGRIVFLTEEESLEVTLQALLPRAFPGFLEYEHWIAIRHQGKSDLERSYPRKMREWREPGVRFVVLRDNDGADCVAPKDRLAKAVPAGAPGHRIRIVCQELESWFLGDLQAVTAAYPQAGRHPKLRRLAKKDPDSLTNAAALLKELTGTGAKVLRARRIAEQLDPAADRSASFRAMLDAVQVLRESAETG